VKAREAGPLGAAMIASVAIAIASWIGVSRITTALRDELGEALGTVLSTTHQAIRSWSDERRRHVQIWADAEEVREPVVRLLTTEATAAVLAAAPAQTELRRLLRPVVTGLGDSGFFVVGPDNVNYASSRNENLGLTNLTERRGAFLGRLWAGTPVMSLPQPSDVPLADADGVLQPGLPTMFVGAPIRDDAGAVLALLLLRVDPRGAFTTILQRGRIGATGETYAFDRSGRLISESRFDDQLREIGLVPEDALGLLNVEIRDPGVDLVAGGEAQLPRGEQPLTLMAAAATRGRSGSNLEGYRDYRGVEVAGAWLWDEDLGLGITTEIDTEESLDVVSRLRIMAIGLTVLAIVMLMSTGAAFVRIQRQERRLQNALAKVLSGYIPICANCKRIRQDDNSWMQVETVISRATEATFNHTICPSCQHELYPFME